MKSERNPNVEFFRCLLMGLIVLGHCYCHGSWYGSAAVWTLLFTICIRWHVDAFVAISGWFGIKTTLKKFIRLWGLMMFYNTIGCALTYWLYPAEFSLGQLFSLGSWFGGCYLALMLMAPLLNAGIEALVQKSHKQALLAAGGVFALVALTWLPGHFLTGVNASGAMQYSFTNMMGVYVVARVLGQMNLSQMPLKKLLWGPAIFLAGILLIGGAKSLLQVYRGLPQCVGCWEWLAFYNAPHYWVMALSMLLIFAWHVRVPAWIGRICVFLAPSMFPIYLMHATTTIGQKGVLELERMLDAAWGLHPCATILLTAICVFAVCLAIDLCRRAIGKALVRCVTS